MLQHLELNSPVVVIAFGGWNDAGDAATDVCRHLRMHYPARLVATLDDEQFFDFQVTRPNVEGHGATRQLSWPRISFSVVSLPDRDLLLVEGPEPNLKWLTFIDVMLDQLEPVEAEAVVLLGAMLSDAPHSRPLPLTGSVHDPAIAERLNLEPSNYEGPTGIVSVLADAMRENSAPVISLWAAVPHYVATAPSPKASLVLLNALETILGAPLELGTLTADVEEWERKVDDLAAEDSEIADYIATLENLSDTTEQAEGSGDEIAAAFERYLKGEGH